MQGTFAHACSLVEGALSGTVRREIVAGLAASTDFRAALLGLRAGMRSNTWTAGSTRLNLAEIVRTCDARTRRDGFHVLNDWDGKSETVNADTIPVDVLHYLVDQRGAGPVDTTGLAILLDYYFVYVLALLSMRAWDDGRADENLDRLNGLLRDLQGPNGSGQRFVRDAATLMLLATSHFEMADTGYATLLDRARTLAPRHQRDLAVVHASALGAHLRFGYETTYARDTIATRDDNPADYPWLCFSLATLMREFARRERVRPERPFDVAQGRPEPVEGRGAGDARAEIVEAILQGLSPDPGAFLGARPPASLAAYEAERAGFGELFVAHRESLVEAFEEYRPSDREYSPMAFFFNFSQNVVKGTVVDALLWGEPWGLALNDLLTGRPRDDALSQSKEKLARSLMAYARSSPDTIRGRLTPAIVYDPPSGRAAFNAAMRRIKG